LKAEPSKEKDRASIASPGVLLLSPPQTDQRS